RLEWLCQPCEQGFGCQCGAWCHGKNVSYLDIGGFVWQDSPRGGDHGRFNPLVGWHAWLSSIRLRGIYHVGGSFGSGLGTVDGGVSNPPSREDV
ncbi:unnamed protein product, partial [Mycena citricolor]